LDPNDLILRLFETIVKIVANVCSVTYATSSDWLFDQWRDVMAWREVGYKGLDRDACMFQWKGIMEHVERRIGIVTLVKISDMVIDPKMYQAVSMYAERGYIGITNTWRRRWEPNTHRLRQGFEETSGGKPQNQMKGEETTFRATRQMKGNQRQGGEVCA
jgi:hypothetical protein